MKTFALLSLVAVTVSAQKSGGSSSGSAPAAAFTGTPVPAGVSSGCNSFLTSLDSDPQVQTCLSSINSATNAISTSSSSSDVSAALGNLCNQSTESSCDESVFRKQLTSFLAACKDELSGSNPNKDVKAIYDNLYTVAPFRESVCSKDDSGNFCLTTTGKQAAQASSLGDTVKDFLAVLVQLPFAKRAEGPFSDNGQYVTPNATTFSAANIPFLFLSSSTPQATLCSPCSQAIIKPYLAFESSVANALGVPNSPLLGGQAKLWDALKNQCGAGFTSGVVANAGANPGGSSNVTIGGALGGATTLEVSVGGVLAAFIGAIVAL